MFLLFATNILIRKQPTLNTLEDKTYPHGIRQKSAPGGERILSRFGTDKESGARGTGLERIPANTPTPHAARKDSAVWGNILYNVKPARSDK